MEVLRPSYMGNKSEMTASSKCPRFQEGQSLEMLTESRPSKLGQAIFYKELQRIDDEVAKIQMCLK